MDQGVHIVVFILGSSSFAHAKPTSQSAQDTRTCSRSNVQASHDKLFASCIHNDSYSSVCVIKCWPEAGVERLDGITPQSTNSYVSLQMSIGYPDAQNEVCNVPAYADSPTNDILHHPIDRFCGCGGERPQWSPQVGSGTALYLRHPRQAPKTKNSGPWSMP